MGSFRIECRVSWVWKTVHFAYSSFQDAELRVIGLSLANRDREYRIVQDNSLVGRYKNGYKI